MLNSKGNYIVHLINLQIAKGGNEQPGKVKISFIVHDVMTVYKSVSLFICRSVCPSICLFSRQLVSQ